MCYGSKISPVKTFETTQLNGNLSVCVNFELLAVLYAECSINPLVCIPSWSGSSISHLRGAAVLPDG